MKEYEIRPKAIFDEYLRLTEIDTKEYFGDSIREEIPCPSCNKMGEFSFEKNNFKYDECHSCGNLYVNPRPIENAFIEYYTKSPSSKYWATTFYKETEQARRKKIWKPKANLIKEMIKDLNDSSYNIIDIGGGFGVFAEEISKIWDYSVIVIEPGPHLAEVCRKKGLIVVEKFLEDVSKEDLPDKRNCFVSFELFEHLHNPENFLNSLNKLMYPGDLFIFSTLSSKGLDIQVLWENSSSVSPPHHLNFFNPYSVRSILEKTGFNNIKVTTPGKLDIDILLNNKEFISDRFWNSFLDKADEIEKIQWQKTITESGWSSHMMVICQKEFKDYE